MAVSAYLPYRCCNRRRPQRHNLSSRPLRKEYSRRPHASYGVIYVSEWPSRVKPASWQLRIQIASDISMTHRPGTDRSDARLESLECTDVPDAAERRSAVVACPAERDWLSVPHRKLAVRLPDEFDDLVLSPPISGVASVLAARDASGSDDMGCRKAPRPIGYAGVAVLQSKVVTGVHWSHVDTIRVTSRLSGRLRFSEPVTSIDQVVGRHSFDGAVANAFCRAGAPRLRVRVDRPPTAEVIRLSARKPSHANSEHSLREGRRDRVR